MRRARIKALAAVPVRKKPIQDTITSTDINDLTDKEKNKESISSNNETETVKDIVKIKESKEEPKKENTTILNTSKQKEQNKQDIFRIEEEKQKEKDVVDTDIPNEEIIKDVTKNKEETIKEKQVDLESIVVKKSGPEQLRSPSKVDTQEFLFTKVNSDKVTDQLAQKNVLPSDTPTATDIVSPTKLQNRSCFMRPTPRLDSGGRIRKNSIQGSGASASESEDELSKRVASVIPNRVRNDSVCSVQSNKEYNINDNQNSPPKFKTVQKRRMVVSESARKLAEARREFLLKHENKTPDRSQLKMYDLIYYNPVTNPMKKSSSVERKQIITPRPIETEEEEDEDDPSIMPTPQVKVGPDGQLIIDKQSLIIEQTDSRKDAEMLTSEPTIEDDNISGFYKKHKRSKEWPKWETFKFYRVLNVVGTDFLLMQTHFPNRSRQEIKQKYKKEERVNRQLVEKALKYHQEFDTDKLEEQLAMLQKLKDIQDAPKKPSEKIKNAQSLSRTERKRRRRLVAESIGECEKISNDQEAGNTIVINEEEVETNSDIRNTQLQIEKKSKARKSKKSIDDKSEEFDDYSSYTDVESDSSEEIYQPRPTRSGRMSKKIRKLQAPKFSATNFENKSSVDNKAVIPSHIAVEVTEYENTSITNSENTETPCSDNIITMIPNVNQMEPGAVVIVSKESAENPGNTILQVYMVASNIESNTTVTPSIASGKKSSESLADKSDKTDSINIIDDSE